MKIYTISCRDKKTNTKVEIPFKDIKEVTVFLDFLKSEDKEVIFNSRERKAGE